jgi:chromosome segregation ATPase
MTKNALATLTAAAIVLAGCQTAQEEMQTRTQDLADQAKASLDQRFDKLKEDARNATQNASAQALAASRAKLVELQGQLANAPNPTPAIQEQAKWAEQQIAKIDAAQRVQDLEKQVQTKVKEAQALQQNAERSVQQVEQTLAKTDKAFRDLQMKLESAQKAYEDAAARAEKAFQVLQGG